MARIGKSLRKLMRKLGLRDYSSLFLKEIFLYVERYTMSVLEDAIDYASHAGTSKISKDDVLLATELLRQNNTACGPQPKIVTASPSTSRRSVGWQSLNYDAIFNPKPKEEPEPIRVSLSNPVKVSIFAPAKPNSLYRRVFNIAEPEPEVPAEIPKPKRKRKRGSTRFTRKKQKKKQ